MKNSNLIKLGKYCCIILIISEFISAQKTVGGKPYSLIHNMETNNQVIQLPPVDVDKLIDEDAQRAVNTPYRYGFRHEGDYTPDNSGSWISPISEFTSVRSSGLKKLSSFS